ncbi:hypothetical protein MMC12_005513 [Toensbergia leucococca]|nr:hypothetical protein [Toensbergia leucococca]
MVATRRKNLMSSRRRVEDDGEEEEGSVAIGIEDDSMSEASAISDADDDADAEGSEATDVDTPGSKIAAQISTMNGHVEVARDTSGQSAMLPKKPTTAAMTDTDAMMNGLKISGDLDVAEEIHFDTMANQPLPTPAPNLPVPNQEATTMSDTLAEKRRREHEEYRKKRDADPAFDKMVLGLSEEEEDEDEVPLEDPSLKLAPADAPWAHDLHDSVTQPDMESASTQAELPNSDITKNSKSASSAFKNQPPNRSFSRTTRTGNVQIRVYMAGMSDPITFSAVPVNQHTRLPHHRPPLRRDKPVRISLPDIPPRYIFPAVDRSFIFIPRALRPNQQGFGRIRGRGSFGGYGGLSSRRTSAYGGSAYSPSVAMSRRSSLAREVPREGIISPAGSSVSRPLGLPSESSKPIVRLPPAAEQMQGSMQQTMPTMGTASLVEFPQAQTYSLPQNPTFRENRPVPIPMYQPRPQKTVSVADIESPATLDFKPPQQQQQQPFHQQVPVQVAGQVYGPDQPIYHSRHPSHPSQASGGTPLSQIPERAIHAQPFQPYPYQQPQPFYPQQYPQPLYYFAPPPPNVGPAIAPSISAPAFVPGQQYPYMPVAPPPPPVEATSQAGTVAHESNGMVYYYDSSQLASGTESSTTYPPAGYPIAQTGGIPPPVHYFPQPSPALYYPPQ